MEGLIKYPKIEPEDNQFQFLSSQDLEKVEESREKWTLTDTMLCKMESSLKGLKVKYILELVDAIVWKFFRAMEIRKKEKLFYYGTPCSEETGVWVPVSVPPVSENKHEEWDRGPCLNGGYFPDDGVRSNQFIGESKDLTMWDVFSEMLIVARGKVSSIASGDVQRYGITWLSSHLLEQTWKDMAQTLAEANFGNSLFLLFLILTIIFQLLFKF
ncbi:hypothetical protein ES332_D12G095400v1 [Gossypium tomentosum]|uniref:Uncharacterized protein n=1 Tax=Gossypium tomentosum TaxID=34277 RepID=A0A5D2I6K2_GOSTO|nr:hypothetical protein ES332_D12G095400v1 [Gossypium tomentosum]